MEEHKISYLPLWEKYLDLFEEVELEYEQIGKLVTMMMRYQFRGQAPESLDPALKTTWFFLKRDLDFARKQYMTSVENGKKGGRKKKTEKPEETCKNPEEPVQTRKNPEKGNTRTESITKTISNTISNTIPIAETNSDSASVPWAFLSDPGIEFARRKEAAMRKLATS